MFIIKHRIVFYVISIALIVASVIVLSVWRLHPGIDFRGGSIIEVEYQSRPTVDAMKATLDGLKLGAYSIRETGEAGYIIRTDELTPAAHDGVLSALSDGGKTVLTEKRFNSIGPVLGKEALEKSWMSIVLVLLAIILFITFAFRKVSKPVSSWKYGVIAIIALAHDVIIPAGVFSVLGRFAGYEIDTLFVTALLVILGFSIHDTIVVFDRIRENLRRNVEYHEKKEFPTIVGESINQTFVRSINTSLTTLLAVAALYIWGPDATEHFSLALLIGIVAGTYSSIFIGSPLLVTLYKWQEKRGK
ncbi:MAG: protein translocase subunit SecF [Candidatus Paceibacterota bacterium]|jgi:preprotein translocase subunit SecF